MWLVDDQKWRSDVLHLAWLPTLQALLLPFHKLINRSVQSSRSIFVLLALVLIFNHLLALHPSELELCRLNLMKHLRIQLSLWKICWPCAVTFVGLKVAQFWSCHQLFITVLVFIVEFKTWFHQRVQDSSDLTGQSAGDWLQLLGIRRPAGLLGYKDGRNRLLYV